MISEADINDTEKFPPLVPQANINENSVTSQILSPQKKKSEKTEKTHSEEVKEEEKAEIKKSFIRIKHNSFIEQFKQIANSIKIDSGLAKFDPNDIPVLNIVTTPELEAINPTPPKEVKDTPKLNPMTPKLTGKSN